MQRLTVSHKPVSLRTKQSRQCESGGMEYTADLESVAAMYAGSNPVPRTNNAGMVQLADSAVSKTVDYGFESRFPHQPVWWNGRHTGFKIRWGKPRNSSSLFTGTKQQATQSERRCSHNVSNRRYSNRKR